MAGKHARLILFACSSRHRIMPPRAPRVLCVVVVTTSQNGTGLRVLLGGNETGEVRHVGDQQRADRVGDLAALEVELARIGRPAGEDQLRAGVLCDQLQLVHVEARSSARTP